MLAPNERCAGNWLWLYIFYMLDCRYCSRFYIDHNLVLGVVDPIYPSVLFVVMIDPTIMTRLWLTLMFSPGDHVTLSSEETLTSANVYSCPSGVDRFKKDRFLLCVCCWSFFCESMVRTKLESFWVSIEIFQTLHIIYTCVYIYICIYIYVYIYITYTYIYIYIICMETPVLVVLMPIGRVVHMPELVEGNL